MIISYRNLFIIAFPCLTLIALAIAVRVSESPTDKAIQPGGIVTQEQLKADSTFFDEEGSQAKSPAKTVVQNTGPVITAAAYFVGNVDTGEVYFSKNKSTVLPVASMSKLITAIAITDTLTSTTTVHITDLSMDVATDTSRLSSGETFTIPELLFPLLLNSSNVAAEALASTSDRAKFLELMSSYAWEVGMPSTFFADPSGISPQNVSTAEDFFNLARYIYKSRPDILKITRTPSLSVGTTTDHGPHDYRSTHPFVNDPNFIGGKTGRTPEARETMITIMNINDRPVAIIVLASNNRKGDTDLLLAKVRTVISKQ